MDKMFKDACDKLQTKSRTLPQILAPFIGMLANIQSAIKTLAPLSSLSAFSGELQDSRLLDEFARLEHITITNRKKKRQEESKGQEPFAMDSFA